MNALADDQPHWCATVVTGVRSASSTSARCSRSWVRHCGNVMPNEEQADLEATLRRLGQQSWHRVTTQGGLEREIESLVDRALQQSAALTPVRRVGLCLAATE